MNSQLLDKGVESRWKIACSPYNQTIGHIWIAQHLSSAQMLPPLSRDRHGKVNMDLQREMLAYTQPEGRATGEFLSLEFDKVRKMSRRLQFDFRQETKSQISSTP